MAITKASFVSAKDATLVCIGLCSYYIISSYQLCSTIGTLLKNITAQSGMCAEANNGKSNDESRDNQNFHS